jgi:hypothetical protein
LQEQPPFIYREFSHERLHFWGGKFPSRGKMTSARFRQPRKVETKLSGRVQRTLEKPHDLSKWLVGGLKILKTTLTKGGSN